MKYTQKIIDEMNCKEIDRINPNKTNVSFEEWYLFLQHYAEMLGEDWERCLITDCGVESWIEFYEMGCGMRKIILEGFEE